MLGIDIDTRHFQVEENFLRISWTYENITPCTDGLLYLGAVLDSRDPVHASKSHF